MGYFNIDFTYSDNMFVIYGSMANLGDFKKDLFKMLNRSKVGFNTGFVDCILDSLLKKE